MFRQIAFVAFLGILLAACNLQRVALRESSAVAAKSGPQLVATVAIQRVTTPMNKSDASQATVIPTLENHQAYQCDVAETISARRVQADVDIDYGDKAATVNEVISFVNRESVDLSTIIIDVQSNQWAGSFELEELTLNGSPTAYELSVNRLEISLEQPLPAGCSLDISLRFHLRPEEIRAGLRSYRGFFGYSSRQLNLAHFLPVVAARVNGDWRIHQPLGIGEQIVYEVADWQVNVNVRDADDSLQLAAPGDVTAIAPGQWQIALQRSRDFAVSLSDKFRVDKAVSADGTEIVIYSFDDASSAAGAAASAGADHVLPLALSAMELFTDLFGEYPYRRFVLVQGDFPDGMEFTGLVFVGSAWFNHFDGTPYNYLTLISVHEIAHQWWYARVGSDGALHPWLDEALATYSEYLYIESRLPADKNWWWTFRVAGFFPQGKVDSAVYEFTTAREYINAIYLRGVQMLHNLREDIGDEQFFALLRAYLAAGDGRIVEPSAFWLQLPKDRAHVTLDTRSEFLRDPTVNALFADSADAGS